MGELVHPAFDLATAAAPVTNLICQHSWIQSFLPLTPHKNVKDKRCSEWSDQSAIDSIFNADQVIHWSICLMPFWTVGEKYQWDEEEESIHRQRVKRGGRIFGRETEEELKLGEDGGFWNRGCETKNKLQKLEDALVVEQMLTPADCSLLLRLLMTAAEPRTQTLDLETWTLPWLNFGWTPDPRHFEDFVSSLVALLEELTQITFAIQVLLKSYNKNKHKNMVCSHFRYLLTLFKIIMIHDI